MEKNNQNFESDLSAITSLFPSLDIQSYQTSLNKSLEELTLVLQQDEKIGQVALALFSSQEKFLDWYCSTINRTQQPLTKLELLEKISNMDYISMFDRAKEVLSPGHASDRLVTSHRDLGDDIPLLMIAEGKADAVLTLLGQIDWGIYT